MLVATIDSLRDSVDLQQTDAVIIGALPEKPGALFQLEGRFSRLGGRPVTLHYLIAERTIDEIYRERVLEKMADISSLGAETQGADGAYEALSGSGMDEDAILADLRAGLADL